MQTRWLGILTAVLAAGLPGASSALDAPHDSSYSDGACDKCHSLYMVKTSSGKENYNQGCVVCHDANQNPASFGFPWNAADEAIPGTGGKSHSWSGYAENPRYGAKMSSALVVQETLLDGRMQCITCHDPHDADNLADPASKHTSIAIDAAVAETGNGTTVGDGAGTATLTLKTAGSVPKAFRLSILTANASGGTFAISHDFGLPTPAYTAPIAFTYGATVALDDPGTSVQFTKGATGALVGDYWDFYISFPFLRFSNTNDVGCVLCHPERAMTHLRTRGEDTKYLPDGVRKFSHPVGDSVAAAPLDANGASQTPGDGNKTNDLVVPGNVVRCTTCHAVHNVDSNSLTTDAR